MVTGNSEFRLKKAGNPDPQLTGNGAATVFQKGMERVPGSGRKKGHKTLQARFGQFLTLKTPAYLPDGTKQDVELMDAIILQLLQKARRGELPSIKEVFDRNFGKVAEKVEMSGPGGGPLETHNYNVALGQAYKNVKDAFGVVVDVPEIEDKNV